MSGAPSNVLPTSALIEVVLRIAATLRDQVGEARVDLAPCPLRGPARRLTVAPVLRVVLADDRVAQVEQPVPVGAGHAEDPRDEREREGRGDVAHRVELPRRVARDGVVDDPARHVATARRAGRAPPSA